jgi:hypothetical protein
MPSCPTCEKSLGTERGVKMHHSQVHGESIAGRVVSCHWCNSSITVKPHQAREYDKNFCTDKNCRGQWLSNTNVGENHNRYNKEEYVCDYCGNDLERTPSHAQGEHIFCDPDCSSNWVSENRRGEDHPLYEGGGTEGFTKGERKKIFRRDNFTCQDCGDDSGGNLNAHHIVPSSESEEQRHDIENGITLCIDCHSQRHNEPIRSFVLAQKD